MTDSTRNLQDQVAIVTGAARGIGRGIAARLAREGASVVVWDRDPDAFDASAAGFTPAAIVKVDVADFASVERAFAATIERTCGNTLSATIACPSAVGCNAPL